MPVTIRGKPEPPSAKKDGVSTPSSTAGKADIKTTSSKIPLGKTGGKAAEALKLSTESKTESPKANNATSSSRQRERERRRVQPEASPESDSSSPEPEANSGRIKNLAGFWSTQKNDAQVVRKKRLEIADRTKKSEDDDSDSDSDSSNDQLDGLRRAQERPTNDEKELMVEIEKGRAKSIASMWQNLNDAEPTSAKKTPFKLDINSEEPTVFENEPVVLEGVVRSEDRQANEEIVLPRPGRIKDLAVNFASICNQNQKSDDSDADEEESEKHSSVTKTEEGIERGKIRNVRERWKKRQQKIAGAEASESSSDSSDDADTPANTVRSTRPTKNKVIEQGKTRNLRDRWTRRQDGSDERDDAVQARQAPVRLHALESAKEHGVFENEPIVRDDVVRADDEQPDVISTQRTKKLRKMWNLMDKETKNDKEMKSVEPATTRIKKKKEKSTDCDSALIKLL